MKAQKTYLKEEFHRGKWIPLMIDNLNTGKEQQAKVRITEDEANEMNLYANDYKIRYVLAEGKNKKIKEDVSDIKEIYKQEVGKKPFGGWNDEVVAEKLEEFRKSQA